MNKADTAFPYCTLKRSCETMPERQSIHGKVIAEGKTKILQQDFEGSTLVYVTNKNDITAGDGMMHDIINEKAVLSTTTACNVFRLLEANGIPVAFKKRIADRTFLAQLCTMRPLEVIVRREAHGTYMDRNPHLEKGHRFPELFSEFFLKTSGKTWKGVKSGKKYPLLKDDPLIEFDFAHRQIKLLYPGYNSRERLVAPKGALAGQEPFLVLPFDEVFLKQDNILMTEFVPMVNIAFKAFLILEEAWRLLDIKLVDFKVEFGIGPDGKLLLADVIDNDSWRLIDRDGQYLDKQRYRDGSDLDTVTQLYKDVADLTDQFTFPS